ncbi:hypothetical protein KIN20_026123 [Parelaphostrongylus tenuis]|uniref:Uncharacterized protein n=1 Tax=Parelaphostrongylus tenuis TaxID=148309 RepID=A0AAD5MZ72_PARTN|nr:hypothetical protein KIN20_026123 [Parelaphostrongylus tenuis]
MLGPKKQEVAKAYGSLPNVGLVKTISGLFLVLKIPIDLECVIEREYLEEATQILKGENYVNYLDMSVISISG